MRADEVVYNQGDVRVKKPILRITVEQETTGAYFASWEGTDGNGIGGYSATPIGAVASALHTLILVLEDRTREKSSA